MFLSGRCVILMTGSVTTQEFPAERQTGETLWIACRPIVLPIRFLAMGIVTY